MIAPTTTTDDVISALAGVTPGSAAAELRSQRPEAMQHAQGSYTALFDPAELVGLSPAERFAIALRVATIHAAAEAADHYRRRLLEAGAVPEIVAAAALEDAGSGSQPDPEVPIRLQVIFRHVDLLSTHPVDATPDDLQALADAGLATVEIVVLSQIIAFVSFQVRVVAALQLIAGRPSEPPSPAVSTTPAGSATSAPSSPA